MSDTLKSILFAAAVLFGFALIFAVTMPQETGAWDGFTYFGGVAAVWAFVAAGIFLGNRISDARARKRGNLPLLLLGALASGLLSCQSVPTATRASTATELATAEQLFPVPTMRTDSAGWTGPTLVSAR